jgi:hypothetical protein
VRTQRIGDYKSGEEEDDDDDEFFNAQGGSEYHCGWLRVFNACNNRQSCLETLRVFINQRVKNQRTAHFRSLETKFRIESELPSPGV